jgi:hypothetical protein
MWFHSLAPFLLSSLLLISPRTEAARSPSVPKNAVLLSSISSLTLRAGKQTSARRSTPIPQAACIGPSEVCKLYAVDIIRCTNAGSDYDQENVQWTCTAELPEEFKFGSTDVSCEGYASSDDPYVLKGSCGVEYRLLLTEKGEEKYGRYAGNNGKTSEDGETALDLVKALFLIIFVVVLLIIVSSFCNASRNGPGGGRPTTFGGGGGGGWNDDPPPPYDYGYPPRKTTRSSYFSTRGSGARQEQWRPGFWTGALGGTAAGYMAGSRNQARRPETQHRGGGLFGGGTGNAGGSSWFGGGGDNAGEGSSRSYGSSPPAASSSRHTSTGFGSTTRR